MLIIRLQRTGKKNQADFRIVLAEKTAPVAKKFTEVLGSYNPRKKDFKIKNEERLKYWISQHVEISPTMHNLLVSKGLLDAKKVRAFNTPKPKAEAPAEVKATEGEGTQANPKPLEEPKPETPIELPQTTPAPENPPSTEAPAPQA